MCANLHVDLCVGCLNVCESTCESVCVDADIHVNVGVREWSWLMVECERICM